MSRCFPFPPPGYEKKARVDNTDLLTKEKNKEKRHKKDKKEKEKKEAKEKKDKDRSKEKHKEKKDRKEKHKEKKDKDRDKERSQTSDEKRVEECSQSYNREKVAPNNVQNNGLKDTKYVQELARRIKIEDDATGSQTVQRITDTNGGAKLPGRLVENIVVGSQSKEKGKKGKSKKEENGKENGQRNHVAGRSLGNAFDQEFYGIDPKRIGGVAQPLEKKKVGKEMKKHKEIDKDKDKEQEKESKSKAKDRDKEEKIAKEMSILSNGQVKLKEGSPKLVENGKDTLGTCISKPPDLLKTGSKNSTFEGNLGKRKEIEINGHLHDNGIWPNKLPRPVSSFQPVMENGRKLESCQNTLQSASALQGTASSHKVDTKNHRNNGSIEHQQSNVLSTRPLPATVQVNEKGKAPPKPPHPDCKYLNQILSVPKLEDWSGFDDQEWLFGCHYLQLKKPKVDSAVVDQTQQVWDQALQLESADVLALPYVIPY